MGRINQISANNYTTAANTVKNDGDNNLYKEKLVFSPSELALNGKRPATIVLTEEQVETKIFQKYGFDVRSKVQAAMLKLRFDTKENPAEQIDWGKGQFVARLNSRGQYEITVNLREKTIEALSGRLISSPPPNTNRAANADPNVTTASRTGINSADYRRRQIENKLNPSLEGLTSEQKELIADLTQVGLSVVGIFDPTGIADGADAIISIGRGDYWGAGISALGIIPYLGDLAKIGKLPKLVKIIEKTVEMAKADGRFAKAVEPLLKGLKNAIDKLPIEKLPKSLQDAVKSLKTKIDDFFEAKAAIGKTPKVDHKGNPYSIKDRERIAELGKDKVKGIIAVEGEAGIAAEKLYGLKLTRFHDEALEFIDQNGKLWDVVSP
ncbi:MAG: hypothetical protein M3525_15745, partial [Acidobacteriota bacterium]|nr:hypothetical protein [Acidobacteriota bacterium]